MRTIKELEDIKEKTEDIYAATDELDNFMNDLYFKFDELLNLMEYLKDQIYDKDTPPHDRELYQSIFDRLNAILHYN